MMSSMNENTALSIYREIEENISKNDSVVLRCGYDIITKKFYFLFRVQNKFIDTTKETDFSVKDVFDDIQEQYYDRYVECSDFHSFMEIVNEAGLDLYSCSSFRDYNFSKEEINCYHLDMNKLKSSTLFSNNQIKTIKESLEILSEYTDSISIQKKYFAKREKPFRLIFTGIERRNKNKDFFYSICFKYFNEFVEFLEGDLSEADLLYMSDLEKLVNTDYSWINFRNALITSRIIKLLSLKNININPTAIREFEEEDPEKQYSYIEYKKDLVQEMLVQKEQMELYFDKVKKCYDKVIVFYYFSDLHLVDRINIMILQKQCISKEDEVFFINQIVDELIEPIEKESSKIQKKAGVDDERRFLLIDGDTSSNYRIFEIFIEALLKKSSCFEKIIFTFGNREFIGLSENEIESISNLIKKNGMIILQNEVLVYFEEFQNSSFSYNFKPQYKILTYDQIKEIEDYKEYFKKARFILLGGVGFNVNSSYYPSIESEKFEEMYDWLISNINDRKLIVMSHYPPLNNSNILNDNYFYCEYRELHNGVIYVHGHTHYNYFYYDGNYAIYADNQIFANYKNGKRMPICLKKFKLENSYDLFSGYTDGIYEIDASAYIDYMHGLNIGMTFSREYDRLFFVRKKKYSCFILENNSKLQILNGGTGKTIPISKIEDVYEKMDGIISYIEENFLNEYEKKIHLISDKIKEIGGEGRIHGCIVDIDFYNHVYLNPVDLKLTAYFAYNMVDKTVYPSIASLLESRIPELYGYLLKKKLAIENSEANNTGDNNDIEVYYLSNENSSPVKYYKTDIYKASREIKKMQKLEYGILSKWPDIDIPKEYFSKCEKLADITITHPNILSDWDYSKNTIEPKKINCISSKSVWWKCNKGHEWETSIREKIAGEECPYCSKLLVWPGDNDFATTQPQLLTEWDYEKNTVSPTNITDIDPKERYWKCQKGHSWKTTIKERLNNDSGCPVCIKIDNNPVWTELQKEWDYEKNSILPTEITDIDTLEIYWKCQKGHSWKTTIEERLNNDLGCPICKKVDSNPVWIELLKEWDYSKNGFVSPIDIIKSGKQVWWKCPVGHSWKGTCINRESGLNCPYCSGKKVLKGFNDIATTHPQLAKEWDMENNTIKPTKVTVSSEEVIWWKAECGHRWRSKISTRLSGNGCPRCSKNNNI